MTPIKKFEDIIACQKARELTKLIYRITRQPGFSKDYPLRNQIRRASISIGSNIAEGFERDGNREFIQFLSNAKGSMGEVRSQLYTALDEGYVEQNEFNQISECCPEISRLLSGFMGYLKDSENRGRKFSSSKNLA